MQVQFETGPVLERIYQEVEQRFSGINDLAHGWEHVGRVYRLALHIAAQEGADSFIVGVAALLHDMGRLVPHAEDEQQNIHHADLSVVEGRQLLAAYHVPADIQEKILHAVLAHSFSRGVEPQTLEARVVRDADRLDGLGAIGILRWAITGEQRSTHQTRSYHPSDPFVRYRGPDDTRYLLDHFYHKLLKLAPTMLTETGQKMAQERTDFMLRYLEEFGKELF